MTKCVKIFGHEDNNQNWVVEKFHVTVGCDNVNIHKSNESFAIRSFNSVNMVHFGLHCYPHLTNNVFEVLFITISCFYS